MCMYVFTHADTHSRDLQMPKASGKHRNSGIFQLQTKPRRLIVPRLTNLFRKRRPPICLLKFFSPGFEACDIFPGLDKGVPSR